MIMIYIKLFISWSERIYTVNKLINNVLELCEPMRKKCPRSISLWLQTVFFVFSERRIEIQLGIELLLFCLCVGVVNTLLYLMCRMCLVMHFVVILDLVHLCEKRVKNPFMCFFSVFNENVLKLIYVVFFSGYDNAE